MNDVIISATLKGSFQEISNDGVRFNLVTKSGGSNGFDEFIVLAYGASAKFLQQHAQSGTRIVAQGRLSSEKLDTDVYHTAITVNRVLSISPAETGIDYTKTLISGPATSEGVKEVSSGKKLASFNIANTRKYISKTKEERSYTTYLSATVWGERAEHLQRDGLIPSEDAFITVEGILKPRQYEKDGTTVNKIDIWVDNIVFNQALIEQEPKRRYEASKEESTSSPPWSSAETPPFEPNVRSGKTKSRVPQEEEESHPF